MKTKISLLFERGEQEYKIRIEKNELDVLSHLLYSNLPFGKEKWRVEKKQIKHYLSVLRKLEHGINDVYYDGLSYEMIPKDERKGKIIFKKCKDKHYMLKRPKWSNKLSMFYEML